MRLFIPKLPSLTLESCLLQLARCLEHHFSHPACDPSRSSYGFLSHIWGGEVPCTLPVRPPRVFAEKKHDFLIAVTPTSLTRALSLQLVVARARYTYQQSLIFLNDRKGMVGLGFQTRPLLWSMVSLSTVLCGCACSLRQSVLKTSQLTTQVAVGLPFTTTSFAIGLLLVMRTTEGLRRRVSCKSCKHA